MFKLQMPSMPIETRQVLFDLSRLLRSRNRAFATGVDRIDLHIGLDLARRFGSDCHFLYAGSEGVAILREDTGMSLLNDLDARWNGASVSRSRLPQQSALTAEIIWRSLTRREQHQVVSEDTTYVVASHSGLGKVKGGMQALDPQKTMRRIVYIHDIIPMEMPEYQRPETRAAFDRYLQELLDAPTTIAANSMDTERRFQKLSDIRKWPIEKSIVLIPRLVGEAESEAAIRPQVSRYISQAKPFFTIVGTIEPRKNHLLLLNLWRQMAEEHEVPPHLCIIGKRGWENENVLDMLERCDAIKGLVSEFGDLNDGEVQAMMRASKALLYPSFTEGLGIPLLEAAALGMECIVSDIPVFREIAPEGTVFLDPLDGPGWKREILSRGKPLQDSLEKRAP